MKNHEAVNGQILQTNKKFSHLKQVQKEKIAEWMYEAYRQHRVVTDRTPNKEGDAEIINVVMQKISEQRIWISEGEIWNYYQSKKNHLCKRFDNAREADEDRTW